MGLDVVGRLFNINLSGRDALPAREFALQFNLPAQGKDKRYRPEQSLSALKKELRAHQNSPLSQLELAIAQLQCLVRYECSSKKRLAMLELVGSEVSALIRYVYGQYRDESGESGNSPRKYNLDHLLELLRLLTVGFQQVFLSLYQLPEHRYQGQRKRLVKVGMRILELFYIEQRVCALCYQLFPPQRWRDFNQVFFVLWLCGEVNEPQPLMVDLPSHLRGSDVASNKIQQVMPRQLFISVQIFGAVDSYTWPSEFVQVLDSYIKLFEPDLKIKPDDGVELQCGHLLTFSNSERPPLYRRTNPRGVGFLIDILSLKQQVSSDYACLNSLEEDEVLQRISAPLSVLTQTQRLAFIDMLQYKLQPRQRRDDRVVIEAYRDFRVISGFMNCYKKLPKGSKTPVTPNNTLSISLDEMLAGRSSVLADDSRDVKHGEWYVINDSKGGVLVRAKETRYLVSLGVGQLALFSPLMDSSSSAQVGYISRLLRSGQGEVSVTIQKLSSQAENVVLQTALMHQSGEAVPAFLIRSVKSMGWQLLVPSKYTEVLSQEGLFMRRGKRLFSIDVVQVLQRHKDYSLFDIQSTESR